MDAHARSPEELETLLEDAVLLDDGPAVAALFETTGVLHTGAGLCGRAAIAAATPASWGGGFVADPRQVVCGADLALVVGPAGTNVARRDPSGTWRYVISVPAGTA